MKKMLLILLIITGCTFTNTYSQGGDRIESLHIAFITRQLQLTPAEAEKFWPVYNTYQDEIRKTTKEHRQKNGGELELQEKILNINKRYKSEFTKVISEDKFNKLMKAESTWGDMVRKEIQNRKNNRPGNE